MVAQRHSRGFTLIELVMVIGVVMILISLVAPVIGRTMFLARTTKYNVAVSQAGTLVSLYCGTYKDVSPIETESAYDNLIVWPEALIRAGLISQLKELEPDANPSYGNSIFLNRALYDRVGDMTPGQTEPMYWAQCDPIAFSSILYPSKLIIVTKNFRRDSDLPWCCFTHVKTYPAAVGFADGHVEVGFWTDFIAEDELVIENNVGWPAHTTWYGHRGRSVK